MSYENEHQAWTLASIYNLCPPRVVVPDHAIDLDHGKYEPDHNDRANERFITLAQTLDGTNILISYEADEFPP
ncbi:hypothetical protein KAR91_20970 [Candidatus Pacearchaeota archaeon]|nr:hypothetical protein [Candidatus Pacearchaeota archaeon]